MSAVISTVISSVSNSAGAVKNIANQVSAQAKGLESEKSLTLTGHALSNLQDQINNLRKAISSVAQFISSSVTPVIDNSVTINGSTVTY